MAERTWTWTVELDGPFFERDPAKTFAENVRSMMAQVAAGGQFDIRQRIGSQGTGRTRDRYRGRVESLVGKKWATTAVLSPYTADLDKYGAKSIMAAAHEIEYGHRSGRRIVGRKVGKHVGRGSALGTGQGRHHVEASKRSLGRYRDRLTPDLMKGIA